MTNPVSLSLPCLLIYHSRMKKSPLTARCFAVGLAGLVIITASSMYVALRMGSLPWPTVFVTVLSVAFIGRFKDSTLEEINCTHTLMSAGAMVAGGLAFTLPGLWMSDPGAYLPVSSILAIALTGAVLGTLFTMLLRKTLIEKENLPYPVGRAAYDTLMASKAGKGAKELFSALGFSAVFTVLRDGLGLIPAGCLLFKGSALFPALAMWISPMALGIGAIIGPVVALMWFGGMVLGYYVLTPSGLALGFFPDMAAATDFRQSLGIGLMIGTGIGVAVKGVLSLIKRSKDKSGAKAPRCLVMTVLAGLVVCAVLLLVFTEIGLLEIILLFAGVYLAAYLSGTLTGQTGINPMEIFGILVMLAVSAVLQPTFVGAFSIAAVVAVACGLTGDVMNDLKSGSLVGTKPGYQLIAEGVGGIAGAVIAAFALLALKNSYGGFGTAELPAPQAAAVAAMARGLSNNLAFTIGVIIGIILFLLNLPSATLGLGVYLPTPTTVTMTIGAAAVMLLKKIFKGRDKLETEVALLSSGFLGGEGIVGVLIAILTLARGL